MDRKESDGPHVAAFNPVQQTHTPVGNETCPSVVATDRSSGVGAGAPRSGAEAPARPASPALGTSGSNAGEISPKRREKGRLRRVAADISGAEWLHDCGRKPVRKGGTVGLRGGAGAPAGFSGVDTCGSWSACPVCAAKIGASRADDLADVLAWAVRQGHTVAMLTLTARHNRGQSLAELWDGLSGAWRHLGKGWGSESEAAYAKREAALVDAWIDYRAGIRERRPRSFTPRRIGLGERHGLLGYVRATEVTHGESGWHVHFHVVMVLDSKALPHGAEDRDDALDQMRAGIFGLWQDGLSKARLTVVDSVREVDGSIARVGADLRVMHGAKLENELARYLTKTTDAEAGHKAARGLAGEATLGQFKKGRQGNRSPFEILGSVVETGDADDAALWSEWVRVSRGRRQMVWSRALREMAGLAVQERTDEEIAAAEYGEVDVLVLPRTTWLDLRDSTRRYDLLDAMEKGGRERAMRTLDRWGLPYLLCDDEGRPLRPEHAHRAA